MQFDKPYRIRRAIVRALYDYSGAQDLDTVCAHPQLNMENTPVELVRLEWNILQQGGIIVALPGYQGAVAKLAPAIRSQMAEHAGNLPHIELLYGAEAL